MSWNSWAEFWAMGGYGLYVWGSYSACAAVFLFEIVMTTRRWKRALVKP